jgi:hypothetical protein
MEENMSLPPLKDRHTVVLEEELRRLRRLYADLTDFFSNVSHTDAISKALEEVSDAIKNIDNELKKRATHSANT